MTSYDSARAELRDAELELMLQRERVAALRRALPPGPTTTDYVFTGEDGPVRLSELSRGPRRSVVLYHFMFGGTQTNPCPMCSMWTDSWNAIIDHLDQRVDFALVSDAPLEETMALAAERGWGNLRWLSSAGTDFKVDIGGADAEGNQWPWLSVWDIVDGAPQLTWSGGAHIDGDHWRGLDLLSPVWHILDLTPTGRGDWMPSLDYAD